MLKMFINLRYDFKRNELLIDKKSYSMKNKNNRQICPKITLMDDVDKTCQGNNHLVTEMKRVKKSNYCQRLGIINNHDFPEK